MLAECCCCDAPALWPSQQGHRALPQSQKASLLPWIAPCPAGWSVLGQSPSSQTPESPLLRLAVALPAAVPLCQQEALHSVTGKFEQFHDLVDTERAVCTYSSL